MPFDAALFRFVIASKSALAALSLLPDETAVSTFFITVFREVRTALLRNRRFSACLALLMADKFFFGLALGGKFNTSLERNFLKYHMEGDKINIAGFMKKLFLC
jgi:hypothetical protein